MSLAMGSAWSFHELQLIHTLHVALVAPSHLLLLPRSAFLYIYCDHRPPGKPPLTAEGSLAVCRAPVALHDGDVLEGQGAEHRAALVADLDGGGARLQDAAVHQQQLHPMTGCSHVRGQSARFESVRVLIIPVAYQSGAAKTAGCRRPPAAAPFRWLQACVRPLSQSSTRTSLSQSGQCLFQGHLRRHRQEYRVVLSTKIDLKQPVWTAWHWLDRQAILSSSSMSIDLGAAESGSYLVVSLR